MRNEREVTLNLKYGLNMTQMCPFTAPMWMENSMYFYKTSATGEHKADTQISTRIYENNI